MESFNVVCLRLGGPQSLIGKQYNWLCEKYLFAAAAAATSPLCCRCCGGSYCYCSCSSTNCWCYCYWHCSWCMCRRYSSCFGILVVAVVLSDVAISVTRRNLPNVYKSCPKMISLEKWKILTLLQILPKNVGDLAKLIFAKGFKKLPKVQKISKSGQTGCTLRSLFTLF